jgi:hypothetical protein
LNAAIPRDSCKLRFLLRYRIAEEVRDPSRDDFESCLGRLNRGLPNLVPGDDAERNYGNGQCSANCNGKTLPQRPVPPRHIYLLTLLCPTGSTA